MVSFPGNGRTVGGGRAALPKLNWGGFEGREEEERKENMEGFTEKRVLTGWPQRQKTLTQTVGNRPNHKQLTKPQVSASIL